MGLRVVHATHILSSPEQPNLAHSPPCPSPHPAQHHCPLPFQEETFLEPTHQEADLPKRNHPNESVTSTIPDNGFSTMKVTFWHSPPNHKLYQNFYFIFV